MSTDLYGVRVEQRSGAQLTLRVFNVYVDCVGLPNPACPDFFFRLLCDRWAWFPDKVPLAREVTEEQHLDEDWVARNAARFVASARVLETRNYPGTLEFDFYYEREGRWRDEHALPQALYQVTVTDPRWAEHLAPGQAWGTTSYASPVRREWELPQEEFNQFLRELPEPPRGQLQELSGAQVQRLVEGLSSRDNYVAWRSADVLREAGPAARAATWRLCQSLDDPDMDVRGYAVRALGAIGDPLAASSLVMVLGRPEPYVQNYAAIGLGNMPGEEALAVPVLRRLLEGDAPPDASLAAGIWFALHRHTGDAGALARFGAALTSADDNVVLHAMDALRLVAARDVEPYLPALIQVLEGPFENASTDALAVLELAGAAAAAAVPALEKLLGRKRLDPGLASAVKHTLLAIHGALPESSSPEGGKKKAPARKPGARKPARKEAAAAKPAASTARKVARRKPVSKPSRKGARLGARGPRGRK